MAGSNPKSATIVEFDWPVLAPVMLAFAFAALNALLLPQGRPNEPIGLLLIGSIFVQPMLFAVWMVLGPCRQ